MTITVAALKPEFFSALRTLIIANKPTFTYNSATVTYNIDASFPNDKAAFPSLVINESNVKLNLLNLDGSGEDYMVTVQLDFYAQEKHGTKAIGTAQSQMANTFIQNMTTFCNTNGLVPMEEFWEDSDISDFTDNGQVLNTGSSILRFKLR